MLLSAAKKFERTCESLHVHTKDNNYNELMNDKTIYSQSESTQLLSFRI